MADAKIRIVTEADPAPVNRYADALASAAAEAEKLKDGKAQFALDAMGHAAQDAAEATESLAFSIANELMPAWTQSTSMAGFLVGGLTDIATRLYDAAEAYDQLADIQGQLGNRSQDLASQWTMGLIPALDLAQARGRALSAGLELTDQQFAAVAAAAQVFAIRNGEDGAQAMERLTGAIIAGNERALRPFGIALEAGSSRAQGTAQALDQLTAAAERNRANVEASTGGFDQLGVQVNKAKEAAITFYGGITNFVLDGLFQLANNTERAARAIGRGDSAGLTQAFFDATDASHQFVGQIPAIGQGLASAAAAARDYAAGLFGIARGTRAAAAAAGGRGIYGSGTSGMGNRQMLDRELNEQRFNDERRRDASRAEVERQRYEDALGGGGGGGGGGGRRGPLDETDLMSDTARRARDDAIDFGGQESLFGMSEGAWAFGQWSNAQGPRRGGPGANAGGSPGERDFLRAGARRRGGRDNSDFDAITTNAERTAESLSKMAEIGDMAFGALNSAVRTHVQAWIEGEESIGKALKGILSQTLQTMAIEAGVKAVMATAEGLFLLATSFGANPMAEVAFAAAAQYAAVAAIAGGGAALVGAIGGGGSRSSAGRGGAGRSSTRDLGADRLGGQGFGGPSVTINIAPGGIIGPDAAEVVGRLAVDGVNRGIRLGGMPRFDSSAIRTSGSRA